MGRIVTYPISCYGTVQLREYCILLIFAPTQNILINYGLRLNSKKNVYNTISHNTLRMSRDMFFIVADRREALD